MRYIQLNNTDLDVSRICLGTAGFGDKLDQEKSFEVLDLSLIHISEPTRH